MKDTGDGIPICHEAKFTWVHWMHYGFLSYPCLNWYKHIKWTQLDSNPLVHFSLYSKNVPLVRFKPKSMQVGKTYLF